MRFSIFGFPVEVNSSIWLLLGVYVLFGIQERTPASEAVTWITVIFLSVLIHELGHAFVARAYRLGPVRIVIHGFGGLTQASRSGTPFQQLLLSLAGPAAGLLLGAVAFALWFLPTPELGQSLLFKLVFINVFWSIFNLLPIFPLDGGQALLALLAIFIPKAALPVTSGIGLTGSLLLALASMATGQIFILFFAGMFVMQNAQVLRAWRAKTRARSSQIR